MLELSRFSPKRRAQNDEGAVLVTVVIVMLVGFVIASMIAASVMFTIQANAGNKSSTQAFIAAESGRDVARGSLTGAINSDGELVCSAGMLHGESSPGEEPAYEYWIRATDAAAPPASWEEVGAAGDVCPTEATNYIVIKSTGTGADGSETTIDSVYGWRKTPDTQPAGTLAYFDGLFKATKSTYEGDIVIRGTSDYECNNGAGNSIQGDLWVVRAGVRVTGDCHVTGSIYANGAIEVKNHNFIVGGDVISENGTITLDANGVTIGGSIHAGGNVSVTKSGTIGNGETIKASGTVSTIPAAWKHVDGSPIVPQPGQPKPVIAPTLDAVFQATKWLEITNSAEWGSDVHTYTGLCSAAALKPELERSNDGRAVFDMSGCGSKITISPGNFTLNRDALFFVPASAEMTLNLTGTILKGTGDPQLLFIHADGNRDDAKPTCGSGKADKLSVGTATQVRTMIYSACGINNTMSLTLSGQLYMGTDGLHLNGGTFTCEPMGWEPTFNNLSCGVTGAGGVFDPSRVRVSLESLTYQTEY